MKKEEKKVYEESEYLKQWKALPRSQRDRLTKKQIAMIDRPDLASDFAVVPEFKEVKQKRVLFVEGRDQLPPESSKVQAQPQRKAGETRQVVRA